MTYEIADEPNPSADFEQLVFQPTAPLLAMMVCGAWLAFPWFIVNSIALGSPTKRQEITMSIVAVAVSAALGLTIFSLVDAGIIESKLTLEILLLGITTWKLGIAYWISNLQSRTFDVYTYYGGTVQKAFYVLAAGSYLRDIVLGASESPIWRVIVSGGV